ncbi:MAG: NADPH:quinone reductase [Solirubrobacteraceae bacterium]|jgi:NADPH:quinone reductase-like Zn-dependent oxidoreductase|nr:NADPH:quinone reductase [Solirubrobacteraceae bacterium]
MHAVVLSEFGEPGVLVPREHPEPVARPGWVVVELRAAALNWHDCLVRRGQYDVPLPHVIGSDGAGVRCDTGEEVVVLPSLHWGPAEEAPAPEWEILGDATDGTYAELVAVPRDNVFPRPPGWSWNEAAALPLAGLTAHRALFARARLQASETVVILGAGGGVASIAVGLAAMAGARVLVTTSSAEKLERARSLGAKDGALYTGDDWPAAIRELTGGRGADVVVDAIGDTWPAALEALAPAGRLVSFGATGSARAVVDVRRFYFAQQTILGTTMGSPRDFAALLRTLGRAPDWRPPVGAILGLDEAAAAHELMERREHTGKIVLEIA